MPDYKSFSDDQLKQAYFQHKDDTDLSELKAIIGAAIYRDLFLDVESEDVLTLEERTAANSDEQLTRNIGRLQRELDEVLEELTFCYNSLQIYKAEAEKRGLKI